jgi:hypothetical protein
VFVTGVSALGAAQEPVDLDYVTIAYDSASGTQLWLSRYDAGGNDLPLGLGLSPDGSRLFVTGNSQRGEAFDATTVGYDTISGSQAWVVRYNSADNGTAKDVGEGLATSPDGARLYVTGVAHDSSGSDSMVGTLAYDTGLVGLRSVVSRKVHGIAGTFDVDLPLTGNPGIECRSGGANGDYTLVFTFANTLTTVGGASVTSGSGSVPSNNIDSSDAHNYIVNLTGVTNAQVITVSLANVTDSAGNFSSAVSATMGVLIGDVNASGVVDGNDVSAVQSRTRQSVNNTNFRYDVNTSGLIDGNDVSLTQGQTRTSLP